jgi:hypothetical protein
MAAGNTYEAIASTSVSSSTGTITFSSIPGTYTDLRLVIQAKCSGTRDLQFQFNGDSGTNYSTLWMYNNSNAVGTAKGNNQNFGYFDWVGAVSDTDFIVTADIMNYANTTTYKTVLNRAGRAASGTDAVVNLWRSTAAITSIAFSFNFFGAQTIEVGSTFSLYGIAAA